MADEKDPKDSIFRRLGGGLASAVENILFAHEDVSEEESAPATDSTSSQPAANSPQNQPVVQRPAARTTAISTADENLVKAILESAEELGKKLTDFESYVKTFDGIIPEEASRFKAAFAAMKKSTQVTVKELLSAADEQIESLKTEKADFLEGIKTKNEEVEQLKIDMAHTDDKIVDLKRQIQELENSKQAKSELSKKLAENIKRATEKFELALAAADELLKARKNKLQSHLKNM
jgi:chromosome segregation ATPase